MTSPPASASAIWKNTEPLHTCNICDVKFCNLALLNLHKAQEHGVKPPTTNVSPHATAAAAATPVSAPLQVSTPEAKTVSSSTSVSNGDSNGLQAQNNGKSHSKVNDLPLHG